MKRLWLQDWPWATVVAINAGLCKEKKALHQPTSDGYVSAQKLWASACPRELTLRETLDNHGNEEEHNQGTKQPGKLKLNTAETFNIQHSTLNIQQPRAEDGGPTNKAEIWKAESRNESGGPRAEIGGRRGGDCRLQIADWRLKMAEDGPSDHGPRTADRVHSCPKVVASFVAFVGFCNFGMVSVPPWLRG